MYFHDESDEGMNGNFIFDQMFYDFPVFRHENFIDVFLYHTIGSTNEWRIGKGLFGSLIFYSWKNTTTECPSFENEQNWLTKVSGSKLYQIIINFSSNSIFNISKH